MDSQNDWQTANGLVLEDATKKAIINLENVLVLAGPGSGKTELLAQKAYYIFKNKKIEKNKKILAISFKRDSAKNLFDRIENRLSLENRSNFVSLTYDAFAKSIVDQFYMSISDFLILGTDYEINFEINDRVRSISGNIYRKDLSNREVASIVSKLNSTKISDLQNNGYLLWKQLIEEKSVSFSMITLLAIHIFYKNPLIVKCFLETYEYVFLDEFQDTTTIQYELIKSIFLNNTSKITAVGDSKQRIMTWAGADKDIFNKFNNDFNATSIELMFNYRSAPKLVEFQKEIYSILNATSLEVKSNTKWNETDGIIQLLEFRDECIESQYMLNDIKQRLNKGTLPNEICILVKQRPDLYLSTILKKMKDYNLNLRIETDYQDLIKENIIVLILSVFSQIFEENNYETFILVRDFVENSQTKDICMSDYELFDIFFNKTREKYNHKLTKKEFNQMLIDIINFLDIDKIKSTYREYNQGQYLSICLNNFSKLFFKEYEFADSNIVLAMEYFTGKFSTPIMTIHKSKGLEYKIVYFLGLEDSAFWNFVNQPLEDKCAFFVALSRAKEEVIFTFCNSRTNMPSVKQSHENINEIYNLLVTSKNTIYLEYE